jgi:hypothetical protein
LLGVLHVQPVNRIGYLRVYSEACAPSRHQVSKVALDERQMAIRFPDVAGAARKTFGSLRDSYRHIAVLRENSPQITCFISRPMRPMQHNHEAGIRPRDVRKIAWSTARATVGPSRRTVLEQTDNKRTIRVLHKPDNLISYQQRQETSSFSHMAVGDHRRQHPRRAMRIGVSLRRVAFEQSVSQLHVSSEP